jgi:hypothetical protein
MLLNSDNYLKYSVIAYLFIALVIWMKKPSIMFDSEKRIKNFGIGKNKTIFYYPIVLIIIAIFIFTIFNNIYLRQSLIN